MMPTMTIHYIITSITKLCIFPSDVLYNNHLILLLAQKQENFDIALIGITSVGAGWIIGEVVKNFLKLPTDPGWGFASSQQKKDEQNMIPAKGPTDAKCSGKCAPGVKCDPTSYTCLDSICDQLVPCGHTHTHQHDTTSTSGKPQKPNSDRCDPKAPCDSSGFCVDIVSKQIIRCTPEKPNNKKCSGRCDRHTDRDCGRVIRCQRTTNRRKPSPPTDITEIPQGSYTPTQPTYTPGGDQTSTYPLPDNTNQSQVPADNTDQTQVPDDSSSQEQPFPSLIQPVQAQPEPSPTPSPSPSTASQTPRPVTRPSAPTPQPSPTPSPITGSSGTDPFGVRKIYPDGSGSSWFMNMSNRLGHNRSNNPEASGNMPRFTRDSDGSEYFRQYQR